MLLWQCGRSNCNAFRGPQGSARDRKAFRTTEIAKLHGLLTATFWHESAVSTVKFLRYTTILAAIFGIFVAFIIRFSRKNFETGNRNCF